LNKSDGIVVLFQTFMIEDHLKMKWRWNQEREVISCTFLVY